MVESINPPRGGHSEEGGVRNRSRSKHDGAWRRLLLLPSLSVCYLNNGSSVTSSLLNDKTGKKRVSLRFSVLYLISVFDTRSDFEEDNKLFVARVDAPPRHITHRTLTRLLGRSCTVYYLTVSVLTFTLRVRDCFVITVLTYWRSVTSISRDPPTRFRAI